MSAVQSQAASMAGLFDLLETTNDSPSFQPSSYATMIDTNGMWLEAFNETTNIGLLLHGTIYEDDYQLFSTTNLLSTNWDLGEILWGADDGETGFTPVPMTNAATFFRAEHANPAMQIWDVQDSQEPNPTNNDPGQVGIVVIQNEDGDHDPTNDIPVYYSIGGTAQNGIDYTNIPGVVTLPVGEYRTYIYINPIADGLKPDQNIILTLMRSTNYLIDPDYHSATNILSANPEVVPTVRGDIKNPCPNAPLAFDLSLDANDPLGLPLTYTILTWPTRGTLDTSSLPNVTYTPTNCYEGNDSFTFKVNDGFHDSAPATVTLLTSSGLQANPTSAQTCRDTLVGFGLNCGIVCGAISGYALLSNPAHGTLDTNYSLPSVFYTPTNASFTGTDSFNYIVYDQCGYSATNSVTITVDDAQLNPNPQNVTTGTNRPVNITFGASDNDPSCTDDASNYTYTIVSGPTNGTLSIGSGASRIYTPNTNFEGMDSFQFVASDGTWTSTNAATVTNFVVAGPILMPGCDPFAVGPFVKLAWGLDGAVQKMQTEGLIVTNFIIYRSNNSGGPYTAIYTNADPMQMSYSDTNIMVGQTNYYVVTFLSYDNDTQKTYESPYSNELMATGHYPFNLISADATWDVWDVSTNHLRIHLGNKKTPFSSFYPSQYRNLLPLPNANWPADSNNVYSIWSNHIVLVIPTNSVSLSNVEYSIAIDNDYYLYLNNTTNYIDMENREGDAFWLPFKSFESVAPGILHYGTNDIFMVIRDRGSYDYFSMVVTTNTCGQ